MGCREKMEGQREGEIKGGRRQRNRMRLCLDCRGPGDFVISHPDFYGHRSLSINTISFSKKPSFSGKKADSRSEAGNIETSLEHLFTPKTQSSRRFPGCVPGLGGQAEETKGGTF